MSERKSDALFIKGLGVFGLFGWYLLYNGIFNGEWINPWNLLPSAIMNAGLFMQGILRQQKLLLTGIYGCIIR